MSIFDGDGRAVLQPQNYPTGTAPIAVKRSTAKHMIKQFLMKGESFHSRAGSTVWVLVTYCLERYTACTVLKSDYGGFVVVKGAVVQEVRGKSIQEINSAVLPKVK